MEWNYYLPVNLIFGRGKSELIGKETAKYGKKALIVTGRNSTKKSGLLDKTINLLIAEGVSYIVFDKVSQNPLTTTVEEGAQIVRENDCDVVVALGGGSIIDAAKGIAFLACNDGDISDYIFNIKKSEKAIPLVLIPTTCGTGSEGNGFAVLTNPQNGDKKSLRCPAIIGKVSIIDSELMETMPKRVLASVGFDALCHCMEAFMSKSAQPMTTMMATEGIKLIIKHLPRVYEGTGSDDDWDAITWASTIGGMVINTAGVTLAHGMEHPASGLKDIVHGQGLAALTPIILKYSIAKENDVFDKLAVVLGGENAKDSVEIINMLLKKIDMQIALSDLGIVEDDVTWMVDNFYKVSSGNLLNHPCDFTEDEIKSIYLEAIG